MRVVAVIPARGGSKGIPRKNLERVGGRSLVQRSVETARLAQTIDKVLVSTDDSEIANQAADSGAEVVNRPEQLSDDLASSESAVLHALKQIEDPHVVILIQPTSPFLWPEDLDELVYVMRSADVDSALTVTAFHGFLWTATDGGLQGVNHVPVPRLRRQDRSIEYLETGGAYAMKVPGFRECGHRFFGQVASVLVPPQRGLEIDDWADLKLARTLAPHVDARWLRRRIPDRPSAIIMDFDGVLTDDRVLTGQDGNESVLSSRGDGMGIERLRSLGLPMLVLSKERNPVTQRRCQKLGLESLTGVDGKLEALHRWAEERHVDLLRAIYVGNDLNDVECMRAVGCALAVEDSHPSALEAASAVLPRRGGRGAVRLLSDILTRVTD